jgi:hypothetical protein
MPPRFLETFGPMMWDVDDEDRVLPLVVSFVCLCVCLIFFKTPNPHPFTPLFHQITKNVCAVFAPRAQVKCLL